QESNDDWTDPDQSYRQRAQNQGAPDCDPRGDALHLGESPKARDCYRSTKHRQRVRELLDDRVNTEWSGVDQEEGDDQLIGARRGDAGDARKVEVHPVLSRLT